MSVEQGERVTRPILTFPGYRASGPGQREERLPCAVGSGPWPEGEAFLREFLWMGEVKSVDLEGTSSLPIEGRAARIRLRLPLIALIYSPLAGSAGATPPGRRRETG
jgi:hypothetical protein